MGPQELDAEIVKQIPPQGCGWYCELELEEGLSTEQMLLRTGLMAPLTSLRMVKGRLWLLISRRPISADCSARNIVSDSPNAPSGQALQQNETGLIYSTVLCQDKPL